MLVVNSRNMQCVPLLPTHSVTCNMYVHVLRLYIHVHVLGLYVYVHVRVLRLYIHVLGSVKECYIIMSAEAMHSSHIRMYYKTSEKGSYVWQLR